MNYLENKIAELEREVTRLRELLADCALRTAYVPVVRELLEYATAAAEQRARNAALAALLTAEECIEGHFEDDCSECRNALAVCRSAIRALKSPEPKAAK